jgi:hypothetical protein
VEILLWGGGGGEAASDCTPHLRWAVLGLTVPTGAQALPLLPSGLSSNSYALLKTLLPGAFRRKASAAPPWIGHRHASSSYPGPDL